MVRDDLWHGVHDLLGRKWTIHVLVTLAEQPHGFNDLKRSHQGLTAKVLSSRLDDLRCRRFVEREVHPTTPPRTMYHLTPAGRRFTDRLLSLEDALEPCECDRPCVAVAGCC